MEKKKQLKVIDVLNPLGEDAKESVGTTLKLVISALTLVSALAWNDAIKGLFETIKADPLLQSLGLLAPFVYAILVTVLTVFIIRKLEKVDENIKKRSEAKANASLKEKK